MNIKSAARKLLNTTPMQVIKGVRNGFAPKVTTPRPQGTPAIFDQKYFAKRDVLIQSCMARVEAGEPIESVFQNIPAMEFDERVVEYTYLAKWLVENHGLDDLLDVGCVLNNKVTVSILSRRIKCLWLCNPALEQTIYPRNRVFYHIAKLDEAFPDRQQFKNVTCLSTIEHIGYDNSQYGSPDPANFVDPSDIPWLSSIEKLASFVAQDGRLLISVPFGVRETVLHPWTGKKCLQVFDSSSIEAAKALLVREGFTCRARVFQASQAGWLEIDADKCTARYAWNTPAAAAVLILQCQKSG